jgi:polyisoprenoid-binding protein YceI
MKNALLLLALGIPALAQNQYSIDPAHSAAQFSVKHMMISNVRGEFKKVTGTVYIDQANPTASKVDAIIDATTISTRDEQRDGHLKSPDFFDVAKYPTLTFQSTKVEKSGPKYLVSGNLTIHGVTKPAVLTVDSLTSEVKDPWGNLRAGASATTTINRKDFGLVWNKAVDNGGVMVGDEVTISLDVEMVRKATPVTATK